MQFTRQLHVCLVCIVTTWVAAAKDAVNSSRRFSPPASDNTQRYHWVVTRDGELVGSVSEVDDPDELNRYSEYDVIITQRRRKRNLSDDDVTGLNDLNDPTVQPGRQTSLDRLIDTMALCSLH